MNKNLLSIAIAASIVLFSTTTIAGGAACNSKKGHGAGLSAEAMKQLKEHHDLLVSEGVSQHSKAKPDEGDAKNETTKSTKTKLIAI